MIIGCLIAVTSIAYGRGNHAGFRQDPTDPLIFGPGIRVGARLQLGLNVLPADWTYSGKLSEQTATDTNLKGFQIIKLSRSIAEPGKSQPTAFSQIPCDFIGSTPILIVFSQDGSRHKFTLDTGAPRSYVRGSLARELNFGREDPLPMCLYLPNDKWVHFKAEVDGSIAVLATPSDDFPVDGILGMNAIACLQLKVDYQERKLWARISSKPLDDKVAASELGVDSTHPKTTSISPVPITLQDTGRYTVDVQFGANSIPLELDTGASLVGLMPSTIAELKLLKIGEAQVLVQSGTKKLSRYLATDVSVGSSKLLFPVIHEGIDPRLSYGGFGPAILPHRRFIIDFPGLRLLTVKPTVDELVAQALGQLISATVRLRNGEVLLDMPDPSGAITKIQDRPISSVILDLRQIADGDSGARDRILKLYQRLNAAHGHFTLRKSGIERTIEIGG